MQSDQHNEYTANFTAALEWIWGEGFLSPGGPAEVGALLEDINLKGCHVLDVGCGVGGIEVLLIERHGAALVTGIDIEQPLIDQSVARARKHGIDNRVRFQLVEPGPLPFPDDSFDVVFSKDSIIHIPDKVGFYHEVLRVLKPGGVFVGSDWLRRGAGVYSAAMQHWLDIVGLTFQMKNLEQTRAAIEQSGFENVGMRDRNQWYVEEMKKELGLLSDEKSAQLAELIGEHNAAQRVKSSNARYEAVKNGELRPTHFKAYKPER